MFMFCMLIKDSVLCSLTVLSLINFVGGIGIKVGPVQVLRVYWGMEVKSHSFLTSAVGGGEWSTSSVVDFSPGKNLGTL
jgi:hypothetical protein